MDNCTKDKIIKKLDEHIKDCKKELLQKENSSKLEVAIIKGAIGAYKEIKFLVEYDLF